MNIGTMFTDLLRNLGCDNFRLSGYECLANFARFLETLLFRNGIVGCDWNCLAGLSGDVNTLLSLYLDWDWNTLLCRHIRAYLLTVVTSTVILQVGYSALHVFYCLDHRVS